MNLIEQLDKIICQAQKDATWLAYRRAAAGIVDVYTSGSAESRAEIKAAFLSSFTIDPLVDYIIVESAALDIRVDTYTGGYGQFNQQILDPDSELYKFSPDITVLMAEFSALVDNAGDSQAEASSIARQAVEQIKSLAEVYKDNHLGILVIANFMAPPQWPLHILTGRETSTIKCANDILQQTFADDPRVQICDLNMLAAYYGFSRAVSPEMMSMARVPFSEGFMAILARKITSHFISFRGLTRKCLVLDCDNTLWGGIIGEDGIGGIALGPDSPGREFVDFQKAILELYHQGVILAINSKNNLDDVMEVLRGHPHMLLKEKHFADIQANWNDKPSNMTEIAKELNIGIDSFVFLDDNPAERSMIRQMLPEVCTIDLPDNPCLYAQTLRQSNEFAKADLTPDDLKRGQIYAAQRQRSKAQKKCSNLNDFLKSLEMTTTIHKAKDADVKRISQLSQRTNQFNLTTKRYSESQITDMLADDSKYIYVLKLKDKFGDNGTVGLAIIAKDPANWQIDTFLMSCRVIGRGAEDALLNKILTDAASENISNVCAEYVRTAKNELVSGFWEKMGFEEIKSNVDSSAWRFDMAAFKPKSFEYLEIVANT